MTKSNPEELFEGAIDEIRGVLRAGAAAEAEKLCDELQAARRIATYGVGREGLMMRALCMRLVHLGLDAHVVGDMTTPPLGPGDALVVSAGPGQFSTVNALLGVAKSAGARTVVITAPTSTTNMTGFFIMVRGLSFTSESVIARLTMGGSKSGRDREPFRGTIDATSSDTGATVVTGILTPKPPLMHQEMFHDWAQRKGREECQCAHNQDHAYKQRHE